MPTFNDLRPVLPFVVEVDGTIVYIKPFAGYYQFMPWFDFGDLDQSAAVAAAQAAADAAADAAVDAYALATDAVALATDANDTAIEALNTANDALALAEDVSVSPVRRVTMWHDESICAFGTPTFGIDTAQRHNYARYSLTQGNVFTNSFVMDLSGGATLYFLGLTNSASGILEITIDSTYLGSIDFYTLATTRNVEKSISIPSGVYGTGYHKLSMSCVTRHGSSSGYAIVLTKMYVISSAGD